MPAVLSVNRVTLIGTLTRDPQLDYTQSGTARCRLNVLTTESYTDRDGQKQEKKQYHDVVLWGETGEAANATAHNGGTVYVEGRIEKRKYEKDGETKHVTEINGYTFAALGEPPAMLDDAPPPEQKRPQAARGTQSPPRGSPQNPAKSGSRLPKSEVDDDSDLPF
jgi:single-strand DNA-binding protein